MMTITFYFYSLIHATDWLTTIVNLAGGITPSNTDGIDQWSTITSKQPKENARIEFIYEFVSDLTRLNVNGAIRYNDYDTSMQIISW